MSSAGRHCASGTVCGESFFENLRMPPLPRLLMPVLGVPLRALSASPYRRQQETSSTSRDRLVLAALAGLSLARDSAGGVRTSGAWAHLEFSRLRGQSTIFLSQPHHTDLNDDCTI